MPSFPVMVEAKLRVVKPEHATDAAQGDVHYRQHSVASGLWGDIPVTSRPLRLPRAEEAQATFLRGMLDTPTEKDRRNPLDWAVSLFLHILLVAAAVIAPMMFTEVLDLRNLQVTFLAAPAPPAPAPPPTAVIQKAVRAAQPVIAVSKLTAPVAIPKKIVMAKDEEMPALDAGGVVGGIPGGESGGVLGGILSSTGTGPAAPPPPAAKEKPSIHRVGGDVKPPRILVHIDPVYPPLARQAHIEGTVVVDAVIDENGNVVQAHAVEGPGLLIPSALNAVLQWKYEPTLLNGERVPLAMHVEVVYHMRQRQSGE
jgi:protein TonB